MSENDEVDSSTFDSDEDSYDESSEVEENDPVAQLLAKRSVSDISHLNELEREELAKSVGRTNRRVSY